MGLVLCGGLGESPSGVWVLVCGFLVGQVDVAPPLPDARLVDGAGVTVVTLCSLVGHTGVVVVSAFGPAGPVGAVSFCLIVLDILRVFSVGHGMYNLLVRGVIPCHRVGGEGTRARGRGVGSLGVMAAAGTTAGSVFQFWPDGGFGVRWMGLDGFWVGHSATNGGLVVQVLLVGHGAGGGIFRDLPVGQSMVSGSGVVVVVGLLVEGKEG